MPVKTSRRLNRAYKIAYWPDVQRIYYTVTLTAFLHRWAMLILGILIPSALTVLEFLAAMNRSSKNGYMGCAVAYSLLAKQIAESTRRPCSQRTLERGLKFLKSVGLVKLHWWTMPDQTIDNGCGARRIKGTEKVETQDGWKTRQIRIIVLTPWAIAMWERGAERKGKDIIPHFAHLLTPAKLAASSKDDQVGKPTMIVPSSDSSDSSTIQDKDKMNSTRPQAAVEQHPSTPSKQETSPDPQTTLLEPTDSPESNQHQTQITSRDAEKGVDKNRATRNLGVATPSSAPRSPSGKRRGCSRTAPPLPKNAKNKTSWAVFRAFILVELHRSLSKFSEREADSVYDRAVWELSGDYPVGFPTVVDWAYWRERFALFMPQQRRAHMLRDILPLLRSTQIPVPSEPRRIEIFEKSGYGSGSNPEKLPPFLKGLWDKFVK